MKISILSILILTVVSCSYSPEENLVIDTLRMSNERLDKANEDNLRQVKFSHLESPEKLDSIFQLIFNLRSKTTELNRLISEATAPDEIIDSKLVAFEKFTSPLILNKTGLLEFDLLRKQNLQNQLSRATLINQILNIENIAQDRIRSSFSIADLLMEPYLDYTLNNRGQDSVVVNLNSYFFQRIEDLDIEVIGRSREEFQIHRPPTFSQLSFSKTTFYKNDSLTIKVTGRHLSNYVDTTIRINTATTKDKLKAASIRLR